MIVLIQSCHILYYFNHYSIYTAELLAAQEMREFTGRRSAEIRASHSRDKVPLKTITVDNSLTIKDEYKPASAISTGPGSTLIVDPTQSRSRLLENSKSMPGMSLPLLPHLSCGYSLTMMIMMIILTRPLLHALSISFSLSSF